MTQKSVTNFKVNQTPGLGAGYFSIEKVQDKASCVIFRNGAKVILHTSYIMPKLSRVGLLKKDKQDALWMETLIYETVDGKAKPTKTTVKTQFQDEKTAEEVKKLFETLL